MNTSPVLERCVRDHATKNTEWRLVITPPSSHFQMQHQSKRAWITSFHGLWAHACAIVRSCCGPEIMQGEFVPFKSWVLGIMPGLVTQEKATPMMSFNISSPRD